MNIPMPLYLIDDIKLACETFDLEIEKFIEISLAFSYFSPTSTFKDLLGEWTGGEIGMLDCDISYLSIELCKSLRKRFADCKNNSNFERDVYVSINIACKDYILNCLDSDDDCNCDCNEQ